MSIFIMSQVWAHSKSTGSARLVLLAIADFADDHGKAYPSVETLAKKAAISERTAQYAIRELVTLGELCVEENAGRRGCNLYGVQNLQGCKTQRKGVQDTTDKGCKIEHKGVQTVAPEPSGTVSRTVSEPSLSNVSPPVHLVTSEQIYAQYPNKVGKPAALKKIEAAMKKHPASFLLTATEAFKLATASWPQSERRFIPHPSTWFNQERFNDDPLTWQREGQREKGRADWA
jgi:Helix-turn-helix domain